MTNLQDLADLAGVSRATASRALNDSPLINEKTKKRVRALAARHNYSINRRARDLRLSRTSVISVVFMLDLRSRQHMSDPFFLDMLGGIADCLAEHDYDLLLSHAPISNLLDLRDSRVLSQSDGVIFIGQSEQHEQLNALAADNHRIVVWGYPMPDKKYVVVGGDNYSGGQQATEHLLKLGRRKIAFFGNTNNPENGARYDGYVAALKGHNISAAPNLQVDVPFEMIRAQAEVEAFVASGQPFDAVVCATDVVALATVSTLQQLGLRVPQDVAVVGYDDISLSAYCSPPLTTIQQNIHWAGRMLVESVLGLINGEEVTDTMLASKLLVRKSCGAATEPKN